MTERILKALEYKTLPQFVFKMNGENFYRTYEYDVIGTENPFFGDFRNPKAVITDIINPNAEIPLNLTDEEIFSFYLLFNVRFHKEMQFRSKFGVNIKDIAAEWKLNSDEAMQLEKLHDEIFLIRGEKQKLENKLRKEREIFQQKMQSLKVEYDIFQSITPWNASKYKETSRNIVYELLIYNSILGIFDNLKLTQIFPVIASSRFFKMHPSFKGFIEYPQKEEELFIKVENQTLILKKSKNYTFIEPRYQMILPKEKNTAREIGRFLSVSKITEMGEVVDIEFTLTDPQNQKYRLDKFLWADLIMNSILSSDFVIDESIRATKIFDTIYMWWLVGEEEIAFRLSQTDTEIKVILINTKVEKVELFTQKISRSLAFYQTMAPQILADYNLVLTEPIDIEFQAKQKKERLKRTAAEIFTGGFVRTSCQRYPRIVDAQEAEMLEAKGYQVMAFPKDSEPYLFACDNRIDHPFVGLSKNKTKTKVEFPFVPCCFKQDQRSKDSYYREYYEGKKKETASTVILKTEKLANQGQTGVLPLKVSEYLYSIGEFKGKRRGVAKGNSSLISCIINIIDNTYISDSDAMDIRRKLSRDKILNSNRQGTFDMSAQEVFNLMNNPDEYLDASMFYTLVELAFNCKLVIFGHENFVYPRYSSGFLEPSLSNDATIILIYENYGSKIDTLEFPQYEVIVDIKNVEKIRQDYKDSLQTFFVEKGKLKKVGFPMEEKETLDPEDIKSQILDVNGQAVALNIQVQGKLVTFYLFNSLSPFSLQVVDEVYSSDSYSEQAISIPNVGVVLGYFKNTDKGPSVMNNFQKLRRAARVLTEQAKYVASKYGSPDYQIGSMEQVPIEKWIQGRIIPVPTEVVAKRLDSIVKLFEKHNREEFNSYKHLRYIPYSFQSILDFKTEQDIIIGETGTESVEEIKFQLEEPRGQPLLFVNISNEIYLCSKISNFPDIPLRVFLWQTKEILQMPDFKMDVLISGDNFYKMKLVK